MNNIINNKIKKKYDKVLCKLLEFQKKNKDIHKILKKQYPIAIVSEEAFDNLNGYVDILHEFIHCYQAETCDEELKMTLEVAKKSIANNDFMWEINYDFPYNSNNFIEVFDKYLEALTIMNTEKLIKVRKQLRDILNKDEFEYMLWQEWKEGSARFVENKIRKRFQCNENNNGKQKPFSRVSFYKSGEAFITFLSNQYAGIDDNVEKLFYKMKEFA